MPSTFTDPNSPRQRLGFDDLPRGIVKFPTFMLDHMEKEQVRLGQRFTSEYARHNLEQQTLSWYYDGLPVAYRPVPDGIEVLALGWEETAQYENNPEAGIRVVQA